jgi:hypothetical protein
VRHPLLGAVISQREQRAAIGHQLFGTLGDGGERITAHHHGLDEIVLGDVHVAAVELILVGKRDRVQDKVERAPGRFDVGEHRVDARRIGDVAMPNDKAIHLLGQRLHALLERLALVGEGEVGAMIAAGARNTPGDRAVVGHAHDQPAFAAHQARGFRH